MTNWINHPNNFGRSEITIKGGYRQVRVSAVTIEPCDDLSVDEAMKEVSDIALANPEIEVTLKIKGFEVVITPQTTVHDVTDALGRAKTGAEQSPYPYGIGEPE